jgi:mannose-6-phosphate isomerase-like protein (cupin superfamily)
VADTTTPFRTALLNQATQVTAPDGSTVRPLCVLPDVASFAHFELAPGQVSRAVSHRTVQEMWYVIAGGGAMWRRQDDEYEVTPLHPGTCLTIPLGTAFQFRADEQGLQVAAVTIPPWPDDPHEAQPEQGPW